MFTLRFTQHYDDGAKREVAISAPHYEKYSRPTIDQVDVSIYRGFTHQSGVMYKVSSNPETFDVCFVENVQGKTIDCIKPNRKEPKRSEL